MELIIKTKTEMLLGVKQLIVTGFGSTKEGEYSLRAATERASESILIKRFDSFDEAADALNKIHNYSVKKYEETGNVVILDEKTIDILLNQDSYHVDPEKIPF